MTMDTYQEYGYANRMQYLVSLAEDFGLPIWKVKVAAELLGPTEDFDGLVSMLDEMI
jgi:hypothetical protein